MKIISIPLFAIFIFCSVSIQAQKIYKVNTAEESQVKVFVTGNESEADLKVINVISGEKAVRDGLWYETSTPNEAVLKIFITENASQADLKIYYVTDESTAGWVNREKRSLLKGNK